MLCAVLRVCRASRAVPLVCRLAAILRPTKDLINDTPPTQPAHNNKQSIRMISTLNGRSLDIVMQMISHQTAPQGRLQPNGRYPRAHPQSPHDQKLQLSCLSSNSAAPRGPFILITTAPKHGCISCNCKATRTPDTLAGTRCGCTVRAVEAGLINSESHQVADLHTDPHSWSLLSSQEGPGYVEATECISHLH